MQLFNYLQKRKTQYQIKIAVVWYTLFNTDVKTAILGKHVETSELQ